LVVLPSALLPAPGGWLRTGPPFGSPLRSTWLQPPISLLTVQPSSVASLRNSDFPCGPSKSRRLSRISVSLLTGSPAFETWFRFTVLPIPESPFQCNLASIFGSPLRTFPRLSHGYIFRFSLLGSSSFATGLRFPAPSEEFALFRRPAANSESPCRVLHPSSPGPKFNLPLRTCLQLSPGSDSWVSPVALRHLSPGSVVQFPF